MIKIIVIIFAFITFLFVINKYIKEEFAIKTDVKFLTYEETQKFLYNDPDGYITNLSPTDLYARGVNDPLEYIQNIVKNVATFSEEDKKLFNSISLKADELLKNEKEFCNISDIPWVFAMTKDNHYEEGLPHTRANIIFVSSSIDRRESELLRTLIHEKLHIYQRMYPEKIAQYLEANGYKRWKQRLGQPRIRANPDLDPWIYIDPKTNNPMAYYYSSDTPNGITDIVFNRDYEHPFEKIAYEISEKYYM